MGEAKLCKVLCQLIASPPSKYPDLIDDHSFSCHFADTQIFLSTSRRQNNTFKFNFKLSREKICIVFFILCDRDPSCGLRVEEKSTQVKWQLSVFSRR